MIEGADAIYGQHDGIRITIREERQSQAERFRSSTRLESELKRRSCVSNRLGELTGQSPGNRAPQRVAGDDTAHLTLVVFEESGHTTKGDGGGDFLGSLALGKSFGESGELLPEVVIVYEHAKVLIAGAR